MEPVVEAYAKTRSRICDVLGAADPADLDRQVPACPAWTARQLLAHVVSMPAAISAGRRPDGDIGTWLEELVAEREGRSIAEQVQEWHALDDALAVLLAGPSGVLFGDLAVHEHDLRGALDEPDHAALEVDVLLPRTVAAFRGPLRARELPAIEVRTAEGVWRTHDGPAGWTLLVDPWEAVRALNSRRTADELRALPCEGDAAPYVEVLHAHLPLPRESLGE